MEAITGLLAEHDITDVADPACAPAAVAAHAVRAENELKAVRQDRRKAAKLDEQIRDRGEQEQVATMLGQLLRAGSFERWLCSEALDSLVEEASVTLMELSGGQYQLDRDDRNDLVVIDYEDAGDARPCTPCPAVRRSRRRWRWPWRCRARLSGSPRGCAT